MNSLLPESDVTSNELRDPAETLKWVGMEGIDVPIANSKIIAGQQSIPCFVDIFVSLDSAKAKGIHMSRLYRLVNETLAGQPLAHNRIRQLLTAAVKSQNGLSHSSRIIFHFNVSVEKKALISDLSGFQRYPCTLDVSYQKHHFHTRLHLSIPYSSTCPCSAGLARERLVEKLMSKFGENDINKNQLVEWLQDHEVGLPTPHSQRSFADLELTFDTIHLPNLTELIRKLEHDIGTPLQTAVKRADEKQFADDNGNNLLFCEDAARRMKLSLANVEGLVSYHLKIRHLESLHAHDAVVLDYY